VVTYHGVLPAGYTSDDEALDGNLVSAEVLRAQIRQLKRSYHVLKEADLLGWLEGERDLPARSVLLTCDDGLQNVLSEMVPVLREENVWCLFFVTGASAGDRAAMLWYEELYLLLMAAPPGELRFRELNLSTQISDRAQRRAVWWNWVQELSRYQAGVRTKVLAEFREQIGSSQEWPPVGHAGAMRRRFCLLTADELRALAQAGMSVGSHTMSHPVLARLSDESVWEEMRASREALGRVLGRPVWAIAYPFGDPASAGAREFDMAAQLGYKCAFVNFGGGFRRNFSRFAIPRVHVTADMNLGEFEAHVSGFHQSLRERFRPEGAALCT
jgi:peptidoglycan/xylan/chitin deacetylase (PgdA/CDA1 family)